MANTPSDFVSWGQQVALTGDLERQLYERALKAAQDEQKAAGTALESAYGETRDANKAEIAESGYAKSAINETGSYNEYLRRQQEAKSKAQSALQGGNSVSSLMRRQYAPQAWGGAAKFDEGTQALLQRQAQLEKQRTQGIEEMVGERNFRAARAAEMQRVTEENEKQVSAQREKRAQDALRLGQRHQQLLRAVQADPSQANVDALLNYAVTRAFNAKLAGKSRSQQLGAYMGALANAPESVIRKYQLGQLGEYGAGQGADAQVLAEFNRRMAALEANNMGSFLLQER